MPKMSVSAHYFYIFEPFKVLKESFTRFTAVVTILLCLKQISVQKRALG